MNMFGVGSPIYRPSRKLDALVAEYLLGWKGLFFLTGGNIPYGEPDDEYNRDAASEYLAIVQGEKKYGCANLRPHREEIPEFSKAFEPLLRTPSVMHNGRALEWYEGLMEKYEIWVGPYEGHYVASGIPLFRDGAWVHAAHPATAICVLAMKLAGHADKLVGLDSPLKLPERVGTF
jgi:hypothetical protein